MPAGGTFGAWDFAGYVVGVVSAFAWERGQRQRVEDATIRKE